MADIKVAIERGGAGGNSVLWGKMISFNYLLNKKIKRSYKIEKE